MSKLLLTFSVAALLYGNCVFGINDKDELYENPWKDEPSESQNAKSQTTQSKDELLELQREKIAKYESALQKLTQQLKEEREKNRLAEEKIEKIQQKLENVKIEDETQKPNKNDDENLSFGSKQDPKQLARLERQKRQLQELNEKFEQNQSNSSQKVKKMVEQIEQQSKNYNSKFGENKRSSFGIEVNHKPANLVLGKRDRPLFDKSVPNDMDWESTPSISNLEQKEIQELNQKLEEDKSNTVKNEKYVSQQKKPTRSENTEFSFGKTTTDTTADLYNSNKIQYYNGWGFNPKSNNHLRETKANPTTPAQIKPKLFEAIENGNLSEVKNAIKNGADIDKSILLLSAAKNGHINIVKFLVEHGADINKTNVYNSTPLLLASENGHVNIVKFLVEHGADINKTDKYGWTSLRAAIKNGHINVVKFLVEHGADINKAAIDKITPLGSAELYEHPDIVDYLKSKGAK